MEITPAIYFPTLYLEDVKRYPHHGGEFAKSGPCGMICGMTADDLIRKGEYKTFSSFPHFLAVTYWMNITYGAGHFVPYFSARCSSFHGMVYDPDSMLFYFEREIVESEFLPSGELLAQYESYFLTETVKEELKKEREILSKRRKETPEAREYRRQAHYTSVDYVEALMRSGLHIKR